MRAETTPDVERLSRPRAIRTWGDARSRSIWQWQLIVALSAGTISVAIALLDPEMYALPTFGGGLVLIMLLTCATLATPWPRLGKDVVALVPALDIAAIGLLYAGNDARLGFLWVFPVAWISTYYSFGWLIAALGEIAALVLAVALHAPITPDLALRLLVVLLVLGLLGMTIQIGARRTRAFARLLRRQSAQLTRTLHRVEAQEAGAAALFESMETGLARVSPQGVVVAANRAYRVLYGIDDISSAQPASAVEYDDYRGFALPRERTTAARAARAEEFDNERVWLFDPNGSWRALDVSSRAMPDGPEPAGILLTVHDATGAFHAARERQTVSSIVSHELRNPLTAIAGHTDLLLDREDLPPDVHDQLSVIENASARMQRLITSALTAHATPPEDARAVLDLRAVATASVEAFHPAACAADVGIRSLLDGELPICGDAFRLRQVVDNLLGNAVKYTGRGGVVTLSAGGSDDTVELVIADTGIGISADDLARVFDRDFRAQSARDSGIPGSGLGMAIARDIVQQHDGTLTVTSTIDVGTRVVLRLPRSSTEGITA
ncbi:HAMP domain-containing histidine kinase [Microbacterium saccharophilum]|uniref:histidine kinase n=1 Tax=Microbacterium saccharophilum TaxID=1213358 RepID=A0A5C8I9B9_9MICO|nr:HAMP domain-containing sensor histidine kinase [Microbacterium saccharophilum]TXK15398.1 HAMP domain-containing histidine kinase [Microbacterium saccharophilum]GEP47105.1 two-component sensor histidine kinase [Microbacterium saccharophilum]